VIRRLAVVAALAVAVPLAACGGGGGSRTVKSTGPRPTPKLAKVDAKALRQFDSAMRALRLGGPEAEETAKARLEDAIKLDGSLWEAFHNLGVIASNQGDDDKAVELFTKALAINPSHTPTRLARAEAHRRAGHNGPARADYEATIKELAEDDPLRRDASARLAALLRDSGSYDDAVAVLRDTLRVSGPSARVYTELGLIYLAQKRLDMVQLVLAKAKELDEKDPAVYNALALMALRMGKAQEAFVRFDYATELDPTYLDARFNKASVLLDAGDYDRAKAELQIIVDKRPDDYAAQVALGVAHRGLKDFKTAQKTWQRVVDRGPRRDPSRADAIFNLAILKSDFLEDVPGAKVMLEQYLQEAPGNHPKRQAADEKRKELGL
jgi:tetratricopeptide (TPR) repeat protein